MNRNCILMSMLLLAACTSSCGSNKDSEAAKDMLSRARMAAYAGNFASAAMTLDSLGSLYPEATGVRREALELLPVINEGLLLNELTRADSLCAVNALRADTLSARLRKVDNEIEPYYAVRDERPGQMLTARLSPDGMLYVISTLSKPRINHTRVSVTAPDGSNASTPSVGRDGERNTITNGAETVHYIGLEADTLAQFIYRHAGTPLKLTFHSSDGRSHSVPLPAHDAQNVATAYDYSATVRQGRMLHLRREAVERKLAVARNQRARAADTATPSAPASPER